MKNVAAAFVFFTRLPFWRIKAFNVPAECYKQVVNYWAIPGWLTAGVMIGVLWLSAHIVPYSLAIIFALLSRLLITGALHEDGLADLLDGFGGGTSKDKILAIMKDSHIGTYGVIGLIFYYLLFYHLLSSFTLSEACVLIFIADPFCKLISSQIVRFLPYARTAETSKNKVVYDNSMTSGLILSCIFGLFPLVFIPTWQWLLAILFPIFTFSLMIFLMKKKIAGYTGDCCGAIFLLTELSFYIGVVVVKALV